VYCNNLEQLNSNNRCVFTCVEFVISESLAKTLAHFGRDFVQIDGPGESVQPLENAKSA